MSAGLVQLPWGTWVAPWHVTRVAVSIKRPSGRMPSFRVAVGLAGCSSEGTYRDRNDAIRARDEVAALISEALDA